MRILLCFLLLSFAIAATAQSKPVYTACIEIDWLHGSSGTSSAFLFSNGIRYKTISASIGAGIDNYVFRSVPLFLDIKKDFGHHRFQPFVEGVAGLNIHAVKDSQKDYLSWQYADMKFRNGMFAKASAGVSVKVSRTTRFFISGGYSYKTTDIRHTDYVPYYSEKPVVNTDSYRLNRWCLAAGFRF